MRHNQHEVESARAIAEGLKVNFIAGLVRVDTGREILAPLPELICAAEDWLPTDPRFQRYDTAKAQSKMPRQFCEWPWTYITINPDGAVSPCCAVYPEKYDFGNILESSFQDVWNGERYVSARTILGGSSKTFNSCITICYICKQNGLLSA